MSVHGFLFSRYQVVSASLGSLKDLGEAGNSVCVCVCAVDVYFSVGMFCLCPSACSTSMSVTSCQFLGALLCLIHS